MTCPACSARVSSTNRFCTQCGSPVPVATGARTGDAGTATDRTGAGSATGSVGTGLGGTTAGIDRTPTGASTRLGGTPTGGTAGTGATAPTTVLPTVDPDGGRADLGDRLDVGDRVAESSRRLGGWFRSAAMETRLAVTGAAVTVLAFLLLPYAQGLGTGVTAGGRVAWRPILAVLAAVLVALALRRERTTGGDQTPLVVAVAASAVAATEAGLIGLVAGGSNPRLRIGYYVILVGTVLVLAASMLAARRCDRLARAHLDA